MMTEQELKQMQALKDEVASLRSELNSLRGFVKALYSMMDEVDFRGINT